MIKILPKKQGLILCILVLVFSSLELGAEDGLSSDKESWDVGIAIFDVNEDNLSLISVSTVISRLLHDGLSDIPEHNLTENERLSLAREVIADEELKLLKKLESYHVNLDNSLFELSINPDKISQEKEKILETRQALKKNRSRLPKSIIVPEKLSIAFPPAEDGGHFWSLNGAIPEIYRKKHELDALITGGIVQAGDYYGIVAYVWTEAGKSVLWEGAIERTELEETADIIASRARGIMLGRPWSSLVVKVEPSVGFISVNNQFAGVGYWSDGILNPGKYSIEVSAHGYKPVVQETVLLPDQHLDIFIEMEAVEVNQVLVSSIPAGASVRLGAMWLGLTPLPVIEPDQIMPLTLEKEGFKSRTVPLTPESERLTIPLDEVLLDPQEEMKKARRRFDSAAAWFSLSLAPTLILMGVNQNLLDQYNKSTSASDKQSSYSTSQITTGVMWGSVAINAGLLILTLINLGKYLKSVEDLAN